MSTNLTLPREREAAETVKDELVDLKDNRAYQLVMARVEDLLQQSRDKLEREQDVSLLSGLQGRAQAFRETLDMVKTLLREIENTDFDKRKVV